MEGTERRKAVRGEGAMDCAYGIVAAGSTGGVQQLNTGVPPLPAMGDEGRGADGCGGQAPGDGCSSGSARGFHAVVSFLTLVYVHTP